MMTVPTISNRYYNSFCRPSSFSSSPSRLPLPSQSEAFFRYQAQNLRQPTQQPWRPSDCLVNNSPNGLKRPPPPSFKQNFMPQRQQYPTNNQRLQHTPSTLSPTSASRDTAPRRTQPNQSTWLNPTDATTRLQATPYLDAPRQRYQSDQPDRGYQQKEEKRVYQFESEATE